MFPKNSSLRTKKIELNSKKITLSPWNNLQLIRYEGLDNDPNKFNQDLIKEHLINPNIECKHSLTLVEEQMVFIELHKLSKSNLLDVKYTCKECNKHVKEKKNITKSDYTFNLENIVKFNNLNKTVIKTKSYIFNLNTYSNYRINFHEDINKEAMNYTCSFVRSFTYNNKEYMIKELDDLVKYIYEELPTDEFKEFVKEFDNVQPKIIQDLKVKCPLGHEQTLDINITDFLV